MSVRPPSLPSPLATALCLAGALLTLGGVAAADAPAAATDAGRTCITHVTVIDPASGDVLPDRRVAIAGDRIVDVTPETDGSPTPCATEVEGRGRYLVPGLWDMHVHGTRRPATHPLYLANGVTGVREMFGPPDAAAARAALEASGRPAPRLYLASPVLDGTPPIWPGSIEVNDAETARRVVREQVERGADFVKVYQQLPRQAYFAILAQSARLGVPVDGHVPSGVTPWEAVAAGQRTVEHLTQIAFACSEDEARIRARPIRSQQQALGAQAEASRSFSEARCDLLFAALRRNGTWMVPTLTVLRSDGLRHRADFRDDDRLRYFDADTRAWLAPPADSPPEARWSDADRAAARELLAFHQRLVGRMHRAGVAILAGTDALNPYLFPGFSLHDELALLVDSGLPPMAALRAATSSAADFMGRSEELGSVAPGHLADLVLLRADPLEDIRNTSEIDAVFLGGEHFDREALDGMLAAAAEGAGER